MCACRRTLFRCRVQEVRVYDLPPDMVTKGTPQQVNGVVELRLTLPRRRLAGFGGFDYKAGQYASLRVPEISRLEWHPFTISSAPCDDFLMFHIKAVGVLPFPASLCMPACTLPACLCISCRKPVSCSCILAVWQPACMPTEAVPSSS